MIMGRDLMGELGLKIDLEHSTLMWDNVTIPMHEVSRFDEENIQDYENEVYLSHDPVTTDAERIKWLTEQKYSKADLNAEVDKLSNLTANQKRGYLVY